jgi:hypothetical protein
MKLVTEFYEKKQAISEPADTFVARKTPQITEEKFQRYIKSSLDERRPKFSTNDVVPPASFVGVPAPRHHERPHQPPDQVQERDQKLVDRQDPDEHRFDEEDALRETTTGDAAGVPPQDAGGLRHAQDAHRGRCAQPLLERERGEATTASARPEHLPVESADQKGDDDFEIITAESSVEQHIYNEMTCSVHSTARPTEHEPTEGRESDRLAQTLPEPEREEPATLPENHLQNHQVKNATLTFDFQLLKLSNIHNNEVALPRKVCIR